MCKYMHLRATWMHICTLICTEVHLCAPIGPNVHSNAFKWPISCIGVHFCANKCTYVHYIALEGTFEQNLVIFKSKVYSKLWLGNAPGSAPAKGEIHPIPDGLTFFGNLYRSYGPLAPGLTALRTGPYGPKASGPLAHFLHHICPYGPRGLGPYGPFITSLRALGCRAKALTPKGPTGLTFLCSTALRPRGRGA